MFAKAGYKIKTLNTIEFKKSMKYNPFAYIKAEKDILKLVNTIIKNTNGTGTKGDYFWEKAEKNLYNALIALIMQEAPPEEQNMSTLMEFIDASETSEENENQKNGVDLLFEEIAENEEKNNLPTSFAVRQYRKYKLAAGKTAKSILISCATRLAPFDIQEVRELMKYDELELETLGDKKTILYVIMSDTDDTFNFIISMLYTQLFNFLCERADTIYKDRGSRLPVHVRFLLDEFANIGQIPRFEKLISTIRSREMSACIVLQAKSQLVDIYDKKADTIVGNCDTTLFLGGQEKTTRKDIEENLGQETIELFNNSENRGQSQSHGISYQKLGRKLMTYDELSVMSRKKCILQISGLRPFFSNKFDITKHKRYKELSDANNKNFFDIERYMKRGHLNIKNMDSVEIVDATKIIDKSLLVDKKEE